MSAGSGADGVVVVGCPVVGGPVVGGPVVGGPVVGCPVVGGAPSSSSELSSPKSSASVCFKLMLTNGDWSDARVALYTRKGADGGGQSEPFGEVPVLQGSP